jgi:hypothetical protein
MKLADYISTRALEIDKFDKYWRDRHKNDPYAYPMEMREEEWGNCFTQWYSTYVVGVEE